MGEVYKLYNNMEEIKDLILEYYKKKNSVISVRFTSETDRGGYNNSPSIILEGLDWNNTTIVAPWSIDLKWLLGVLIEKGPWCEELNHLYIPTRGYGIG